MFSVCDIHVGLGRFQEFKLFQQFNDFQDFKDHSLRRESEQFAALTSSYSTVSPILSSSSSSSSLSVFSNNSSSSRSVFSPFGSCNSSCDSTYSPSVFNQRESSEEYSQEFEGDLEEDVVPFLTLAKRPTVNLPKTGSYFSLYFLLLKYIGPLLCLNPRAAASPKRRKVDLQPGYDYKPGM